MVRRIQDQLRRFLECVFEPDDIVEVRCLPSKKSTWHKAKGLPAEAAPLNTENRAGENIYVGANPRTCVGDGKKAKDCPGGRCGKCRRCVALARCLSVDIDHVTVTEGRARIKKANLPEPTCLVMTGHGVQAWWRLAEPIADLTKWTAYQKALEAVLNSDEVHDAPRVMRLPGFQNTKEEPWVGAKLVTCDPRRRYEMSKFPKPREHQPPNAACEESGVAAAEEVRQRDPNAVASAKAYAQMWEGVREGHRNSSAQQHAACLTRDFALTDQEAWPILASWNEKNNPPLNVQELRKCLENGRKYGRNPIGCKLTTAIEETDPHMPWVPFPICVLPSLVRCYVEEVAAALGCDPAFIVPPLLSGLAACIGTTRRLTLKNTWQAPCIIWSAVIAESGTLKSPSFDLALRPLRERQQEAFKEHREALEDHKRAIAEYEADFGQWGKTGRAKGEQPPKKPEPPEATRYVCSDVTVEALAAVLKSNPRGVLLARDELGGWLGSFGAYKHGRGGDVEQWLELHRAGLLLIDRKTGDRKTIHVSRAAVGVTGTIQPTTLKRALGQEYFDNGLAARLLMVMPPRSRKRWTDNDLSPSVRDAFARLVERLLSLKHGDGSDDDPVPIDVAFSREGKQAWVRFYNEFGDEQLAVHGDLASAFSKIEGYAARLALLIHFIRWADHDLSLRAESEVDDRSVEAAVTIAHWFAYETRRIYRTLSESEEVRERRELIQFIRNRGGQITPRKLAQASRQYQPTEVARDALDRLAKEGHGAWVEPPPGPGGGRPSKAFRLNDPTFGLQPIKTETARSVYETHYNAPENGGSVDVDNVDTSGNTPPEPESGWSAAVADRLGLGAEGEW